MTTLHDELEIRMNPQLNHRINRNLILDHSVIKFEKSIQLKIAQQDRVTEEVGPKDKGETGLE